MMNQFGLSGQNGVTRDLTHLDGPNRTDCIELEIVSDLSLIIMGKIIINVPVNFMKPKQMT